MANKYCRTHRHLRRLDRVWLDPPIFFVTACTRKRKAMLASEQVAEILIDEWQSAQQRHGWHVGRYVIMPDHVHLFCTPNRNSTSLSGFVGAWKRGAAGEFRKCRGQRPRLQARFGSANFSIISCVPRKATTKNGITCATIQFGPAWHEALPIGHSREKLMTSGCSRGRCPRLTLKNSIRGDGECFFACLCCS